MSMRIEVHLPDDLVEFVDEAVRQGDASSRAAMVARALRHERRRAQAVRDAASLVRTGPDSDLDELARIYAATPMADLD